MQRSSLDLFFSPTLVSDVLLACSDDVLSSAGQPTTQECLCTCDYALSFSSNISNSFRNYGQAWVDITTIS